MTPHRDPCRGYVPFPSFVPTSVLLLLYTMSVIPVGTDSIPLSLLFTGKSRLDSTPPYRPYHLRVRLISNQHPVDPSAGLEPVPPREVISISTFTDCPLQQGVVTRISDSLTHEVRISPEIHCNVVGSVQLHVFIHQ